MISMVSLPLIAGVVYLSFGLLAVIAVQEAKFAYGKDRL